MGKVLIYGVRENIGGIEKYAAALSEFCDNAAMKYGYIITGEKYAYKNIIDKANVEYFFIPQKRNIRNIFLLQEILKENRETYDTVYFNASCFYYTIPYFLARRYNYKIVVHAHLGYGKNKLNFLHYLNRVWINKIAVCKMTCSITAAKWVFGSKYKEAVFIPNAIDIEKFKFNKIIRNQEREKLKVADDEILIGNVGRLTAEKNQGKLVELLCGIRGRGIKCKLVLVGEGVDRSLLEKKSKVLKCENDIIFYGETRNVEKVLNAMDVFVLPSYREGFPITLVEAQASGITCIASSNVTEEVNITGNIRFIDLNESDDVWANAILEAAKVERRDTSKCLADAGFDVRTLESKVWKLLQG